MDALPILKNSRFQPFIQSTVKFSDNRCNITIHQITPPTSFYVEGRNIFADSGKCLVLNGVRGESRDKLFDDIVRLQKLNAQNIRIIVTSPTGQTAECPLT